eukprot:582106-Prorocentrum_minimum.AAC.2
MQKGMLDCRTISVVVYFGKFRWVHLENIPALPASDWSVTRIHAARLAHPRGRLVQALEDEVLSVAAAQNPNGEVGIHDLSELLHLTRHDMALLQVHA